MNEPIDLQTRLELAFGERVTGDTARFFESEPRAIVASVREKAPVEQHQRGALWA